MEGIKQTLHRLKFSIVSMQRLISLYAGSAFMECIIIFPYICMVVANHSTAKE